MGKILSRTSLKYVDIQPIAYNQSCNMVIRTNTTNRQTYDAVTGEFGPDYGNSNLIIFPECHLIDTDSPIATQLINSKLSSFHWEEVTSSGNTVIQESNAGYEFVNSGDYRGQITVKKNNVIGVRKSLRFVGNWVDTVSGYNYRFTKDIPLIVEDITDASASITLDMPSVNKWNPFRNPKECKINAKVMVGKHDLTDSPNTKLFWYRFYENRSRKLITSVDDEDNWEITKVIKGENGQIIGIEVDRDKMGEGIAYDVYCAYRLDKNFPSAPEEGDPVASTALTRVFPAIEAQFINSNASLNSSIGSVLLKAIVSDNLGVIPNWEDIAYAAWYTVEQTVSNGQITNVRKLVGTGSEITVTMEQAKKIQLDIIDRGPTMALVDDDANYLADDEGAALVEKSVI